MAHFRKENATETLGKHVWRLFHDSIHPQHAGSVQHHRITASWDHLGRRRPLRPSSPSVNLAQLLLSSEAPRQRPHFLQHPAAPTECF